MAVRHLSDGNDDGTVLGLSATDKISFYNATPVVRQSHIADATDAGTVIVTCNAILAALETYGLLATS